MNLRYLIWCAVALMCLASCKEEDADRVEEYPDWQLTNDSYFSQLVADAQTKKSAGQSWELYTSYTKPDAGYAIQYYDYVVVEQLDNGTGDNCPLLTDSVDVHYVGHLLPSVHYPQGYEFDKSYSGTFDAEVASPLSFALINVVDGFATALQHMHRGAHWRVYIPYQLGYGANAQTSIPAYSTLIFDLRLEDFWQKEKGDRY